MIYKFVKWEVPPLESLEKTTYYIIHEKLKNGEELTREEKNEAIDDGKGHKLYGWYFSYKQFLNEFWVHTQCYGIQRIWALDKTAVRHSIASKCVGKIYKIIEVK